MISILISVLLCFSFAFSWYFRQFDIAIISLQVFAVYGFCCLFDAAAGLFNLGRTLDGSIRKKKTVALTFVGRIFNTYQELVSFRVNASNEPELRNTAELRPAQPEQEHNLFTFMQDNLAELDNAFKPVAVAILYKDRDYNQINLIQKGFRGKRFEEQLKLLYSGVLSSGHDRWLGIQDTLQNDFPSEDFSSSGIRFLVATDFERYSIRGVLCLAYESERRPQSTVKEKLESFANDIQRELTTFSNMQELKDKAQAAEQKSEERSRFLTEVSHDIRSPLHNVRAILSILREDLGAITDGQKLADTALRNCDQVDQLLESLVDFARYRAGKLKAKKEVFSLSDLIEDSIRAHSYSARLKMLSLSYSQPAEAVYCNADRTQVMRVVNNLLSNAIKYTENGNISVSLSANSEGFCSVRVADSGCGMTEEQLKQLFTPFVRFTQNENNGTGLGLAVSKLLLEANSANLEVRSEPGLGSVFVFSLQHVRQHKEAEDKARILNFPANTHSPLSGLSLLIVDDDSDSAESLSRYLISKGVKAEGVSSVQQALEKIENQIFDVVITDNRMPEGGGARIVQQCNQLTRKPVLVVLSGDIQEAGELVEMGASCAMQKPVDLEQLEEYLQDLFFTYNNKVIGI